MVRLLNAVRSQVLDAEMKLAVEVHKDLQAWEFKMFLDEVGTDFVGFIWTPAIRCSSWSIH